MGWFWFLTLVGILVVAVIVFRSGAVDVPKARTALQGVVESVKDAVRKLKER